MARDSELVYRVNRGVSGMSDGQSRRHATGYGYKKDTLRKEKEHAAYANNLVWNRRSCPASESREVRKASLRNVLEGPEPTRRGGFDPETLHLAAQAARELQGYTESETWADDLIDEAQDLEEVVKFIKKLFKKTQAKQRIQDMTPAEREASRKRHIARMAQRTQVDPNDPRLKKVGYSRGAAAANRPKFSQKRAMQSGARPLANPKR